ncbi:hypothetical protein Tco_0092199 [Tanacetum coccineum]
MGTPTQVCVWSCPNFSALAGRPFSFLYFVSCVMIDHYVAFPSFRHCRGVTELIVALRGEIYFVKFIINPEEDDVELGVILGRKFLRMTKAITDFGAGTVIIYPEFDPYMEDIEEEEKSVDD